MITSHPVARSLERLAAQAKAVDAPFDGALDQPSVLEHFEVPRDGRLCGSEMSPELARAARLAARQGMDHRAPRRVGERVERAIERGLAMHS
jgi:hypothetical protein